MEPGRLKAVPFFSGMSKSELAAIAQQTDEVDVPAGKVLAREGDFGEEFFLIDAGTAQVTRGGESIAELGAGDFFGEMALLGHTRRSASVKATEPVDALVIETIYFDPFLIQNPSVAVAILHGVVERLREVQERVDSAGSA
jgi:CRP/FNR family transcriptional regulator, cyclic AMP receptor protein